MRNYQSQIHNRLFSPTPCRYAFTRAVSVASTAKCLEHTSHPATDCHTDSKLLTQFHLGHFSVRHAPSAIPQKKIDKNKKKQIAYSFMRSAFLASTTLSHHDYAQPPRLGSGTTDYAQTMRPSFLGAAAGGSQSAKPIAQFAIPVHSPSIPSDLRISFPSSLSNSSRAR